MNNAICEMITNRVLEQMEKGIIPWRKPWIVNGCAKSHRDGRKYSLLNQILTGGTGEYLTYAEAVKEGGHVKKGARGSVVVFWSMFHKEEVDEETGEIVPHNIPVLKKYVVFEVSQCEGIERKFPIETAEGIQLNKTAEEVVRDYQSKTGIEIIRDRLSNRAFYAPEQDYIQVPTPEQFSSQSEYYSTLFHEMTHSTGHKSRLNRLTKGGKGSPAYSKEELIAEIGAATINSKLNLETESSFENSVAYLESWLNALRNDKTLIVAAAGKAEKAVEYILA